MKTMTLAEFLAALKAQGVPSPRQAFLVCPMCGTLQNADDLIRAGAGTTFDEVEKYLGFSCVGRWTHGKPPPVEKGTQVGCDWTLGGLFQTHELEVVTPDGTKHPRFMPATPEQVREHVAKLLGPLREALVNLPEGISMADDRDRMIQDEHIDALRTTIAEMERWGV